VDIEKKVFLLAIYKKKDDESVKDVILQMEDAKVFTFKEGKKILKAFKNEKLIVENKLTFSGISLAQKAEQEFKL